MRILVVEDDRHRSGQLHRTFQEEGFVVDQTHDGEEARFLGEMEEYDAVVLDLGLPKCDGIAVLKFWRAAGPSVPVLILTARDDWSDKVAGFRAGADDYVTKPFRMEEIVVRVRALIRRAGGHADAVSALRCLHRARQLDISLHFGGEPVFAGEQQDLEEMLGNLLDNACKWAASRVAVTCFGENAVVTIVIAGDGPRMPSAAPAEAHDRAQRQDPQAAGIGIAIVEEIAGLYGGGVSDRRADIGGLEVRLTLPAIQAQRTPA